MENTAPKGETRDLERERQRHLGPSRSDVRELPLASQAAEWPRDELDQNAIRPAQRIARLEAALKPEHADVERGLDDVSLPRVDARAAAPVQELRIFLDVVHEIEHLLRGVGHPRAALHCRQKALLDLTPGVFFGG